MIRKLLMISLCMGMWFTALWAEDPADYFRAQTDRTSVNLGDQVLYTVEVMVASAQQSSPDITPPDLTSLFQVQDTITRSSINILNGRTYVVNFKEVTLIANHTGNLTLPPSEVQWVDPATKQRVVKQTNAVLLQVNEATGATALPTPTPEIGILRSNKSMAHISVNQWLPIALVVILIPALLYGVSYYRNRPIPVPKEPEAPIDPRSPLERALDALKEAERLKQEGKINELYSLLSMVLRQYLEEEYKFNAREMTTRELLLEMEKLDFKTEFVERYRPYFVESDHVKFANLVPDKELIDTIDLRTREIILDPDKRIVRQPPPPEELPALNPDGTTPEAGESASDVQLASAAGTEESKPESH